MKEAYMREGPDHTDDRMIMNVARVCAGCSRAYPTEPCRTCSFNPAQYTDAKRANLMRANAQIGFDERPLQREHLANSISTGITFMLLVLSFVLIIAVPQCSKRAQTSPWERKVETAIRLTHENIRDVSQDGLVNCQDYAVLFEHYFTGASIIFNPMIGPTGHLYNSITIGSGGRRETIYIEPQAPNGKYRMEEAWPEWNKVKLLGVNVTHAWRDLGWHE